MDRQLEQKELQDVLPIEAEERAEVTEMRYPEMYRPGHTMFCWDIVADTLEPVVFAERNVIMTPDPKLSKVHQSVNQQKFVMKKNCIYIQALNKKNAWKKIKRMGFDELAAVNNEENVALEE